MARGMRNRLWSDIVSPLPEGEGIKGVRTRGHGVRTARVTAAAAAALALAGCLLAAAGAGAGGAIYVTDRGAEAVIPAGLDRAATATRQAFGQLKIHETDRKSTRLNSSHRCISYAVFCLKKKKKKKNKR